MVLIALAAAVVVGVVAMFLLGPGAKGPTQQERDFQFSDSAYGRVLPIGRGRVRVSGDLIYARQVRKVVTRQKQGKGGGGTTTENTTYFVDAIYAFAEASVFGPAKSVSRVWAGSTLIYDRTGNSTTDTLPDVTVRTYLGADPGVEEPDAMQIQDEGTLAAAHPGVVKVAIENFPLEISGNNIPSLTAEIDFEQVVDFDPQPTDLAVIVRWADMYGIGSLEETEQFSDDLAAPIVALAASENFLSNPAYQDSYANMALASLQEIADALVARDLPDVRISVWFVKEPPTTLFYDPNDTGSWGNPALDDNTQVLRITVTAAQGFRNVELPDIPANLDDLPDKDTGPYEALLAVRDAQNAGESFDGMIVYWNDADHPTFGFPGDIWADGNEMRQAYVDVMNDIRQNGLTYTRFVDRSSIPFPFDVNTTDPEDTGFNIGTLTDGAPQENLYTSFPGNMVTRDVRYIAGIKQHLEQNGELRCDLTNRTDSAETNTIFGALDTQPPAANNSGTHNTFLDCFLSDFEVAGDGYVPLQDVIREICVRLGLEETTDFDVSQVTDGPWGWVIDSRITGAEALSRAMASFYVLVGQEDGVIKFQDRGAASVVTIPVSNFVVTESGEVESDASFPWEVTQADARDINSAAEISYRDPQRDYEENLATHRRPGFPEEPLQQDEPLTLNTDFALRFSDAAERAITWTYIPWNERDTITGKLPYWYINLVANDIISIDFEVPGEPPVRARVTKANWASGGYVDFEAVFEEVSAYEVSQLATLTQNFTPVSELKDLEPVSVQFLDINLLQDTDDGGQAVSVGYVGMTGLYTPNGYSGATLFKLVDIDYESVAQTVETHRFGTIIAAPPDRTFGYWEEDEIRVQMVTPQTDLVSVDYDTLLSAQANPAVILKATGDHEIIQFENVTYESGNVVTLTGLMRGKRGTDTMISGTAVADVVVFPTTQSIDSVTTPTTEIGFSNTYRPVPDGEPFETAADVQNTYTGNDLKPYAPINPAVTREGNNDLTITWERRSRVGAGLVNNVWTHPLNEASEEYELDIRDGAGGTIVRTVTGLSSPTYTYTSADQTTDGLSLSAGTAYIDIYQVSGIVGRGYAYEYAEEIL